MHAGRWRHGWDERGNGYSIGAPGCSSSLDITQIYKLTHFPGCWSFTGAGRAQLLYRRASAGGGSN